MDNSTAATKQPPNVLGIVNALNNLAQIELGVQIDSRYTVLQTRIARGAAGERKEKFRIKYKNKQHVQLARNIGAFGANDMS